MATTYINPRTDYGFKYLFGTEEVMIGFLNEVLKDEPGFEPILKIEYRDKEMAKMNRFNRGVVYDLLCTTNSGHHFIVEMQKATQQHFIDRSIFYVSKSIADQGRKGKEWNFEIKHVFMLSILEFTLPVLGQKVRTDAMILDLDTHKPISDKVRFIYVQLPHFLKRSWEDCTNDFELWIYLLKHMETMDTIPFARPGSVFERINDLASYAQLTPQEQFEYDQDLQVYRDYKNTISYAEHQAEARGRAEGRAEGRANIIVEMFRNGMSAELIARYTKLTTDKIREILSSSANQE